MFGQHMPSHAPHVGVDVDILAGITKLGEQVARNTKLGQQSFVYLPLQIDFLGFLGKWKAVEENWKAIEENWKAFAESRKALRKAESRWQKLESR